MSEVREMRIGPERPSAAWEAGPRGGCPKCGGQCDGDDCGLHKAGCIFGGFSYGYWLIADGCDLWHGDPEAEAERNFSTRSIKG